jgi:ACS family hexuronate transporter-like MFS transporter
MTTRTIKGLRWWMIGLFMIGTVLSYLTRASLAVAAPTLMGELDISSEQYGYITGVFQFGLMLSPVVGYILDIIGLKVGLAIFAGAWALITMAHGFANNWQMLAALRGIMGFAESSAQPSGMKMVSEWFPAKERGMGSGIYNVGASVGSMLAPPLIAWAILAYNWRMAFILTGAVALIWVAVWFFVYRSPKEHPRLSAEERDYILSGQEAHLQADGKRPSILSILRQRNFWGIALPRFLADPTWGTLAFWVPLYLSTARGFDLKQIAMFAWLPFVAADLGAMFGPTVVLWLQNRGVSLVNARRGAFTLGAVLMTGMIFVGRVADPYVAIALLCLGGFAHQTLSVTVITMAGDLFKRNEVGTVVGLGGTFGNGGVLVFSLLIGLLVDRFGYEPFFVALGVLDIVAAIILWTFVIDPARKLSAPVTSNG